MVRELAERLTLILASIAIGVIVGCALLSPPISASGQAEQSTNATQITAQAAPGSVVQVGTPTASTTAAQPP